MSPMKCNFSVFADIGLISHINIRSGQAYFTCMFFGLQEEVGDPAENRGLRPGGTAVVKTRQNLNTTAL